MHTQNNNDPIGLTQNETESDPTFGVPPELLRTAIELSTTGYVRNGKIARLPEAIRKIVNQMLDENRYYHQIVARLAELGHPGIRPQNLSEWRKGGYQDWLRLKQELDGLKSDRERLLHLANDSKAAENLARNNDFLLALRLNRILSKAMDCDIEKLLSLRFFKLTYLVGKQMRDLTARERLEFERQRAASNDGKARS